MANKTPRAIGTMLHRFRVDIPPFEVTTFSSYYDFGTEYYAGSKVGGESYTLMANTWRFIRFSEKDDDGMNKESEVIDELIEDERCDCETQPEKTEWKPGEKPPCGVWLDCYYSDGYHYGTIMFKFIGSEYGVYVEKGSESVESTIRWGIYNYFLHVNPIDKAIAKIAKALAGEVMGSDAADDINFSTENDYSRDYRNMAKAIINGDIPFTNYNGDK
ncbi:hypothetical protein U2S04_003052 [Escherichia coli]|uniref:hypothetical protein n=1 Tax=Escherichia coli TaxID=562 RepID=UPI0016B91514|nr:hypothetical protein [Escherichia coli]EFN8668128.1 hypothetical protein [Escherichia coli O171]EEX3831675.1 hypothetical protein [Escherichia coli]EFA6222134.1 hypothetical protein [Escherichia coli]EFG3466685.1 hypothetical protein [Escherichia coli]EFK5485605.1 hypothetical protein [Escherichia coli]